MILSMSAQAWLFVATVGVGAGVGVFFDLFRVLRLVMRHPRWLVYPEDAAFWLIATVVVFYYMLHRSGGEIRLFALLGMALGAVLYFATVSRLLVRVAAMLVQYLKRVVRVVFRIVLLPLNLLLAFLAPPVKKIGHKIKAYLRRVQRYGKMKREKAARNRAILRKKV